MQCGCDSHRLVRLVLLLAASILSGCSKGPATGDVSGTVTLAGQALHVDGLLITFLSDDGTPPVCAEVKPDGTFQATGVRAGKVMVGLTYTSPAEKRRADARRELSSRRLEFKGTDQKAFLLKERKLVNEAIGAGLDTEEGLIPSQYRDPRTSGKTIVVQAGQQNPFTWDIQL